MKAQISFSEQDVDNRPHRIRLELILEENDDPEIVRELCAHQKKPVFIDISLTNRKLGLCDTTIKTYRL